MAPRKSTTTRDGRSKAFRSIMKQTRFQTAITRQPVQVSALLPRSDPDAMDEGASEEVPSRRPMRRLSPLYFSKSVRSVSTGRKLPVPADQSTAVGSTGRRKVKVGGTLNKVAALPKRNSPDPEYPTSDSSSQHSSDDSAFSIEDYDMDLDVLSTSPSPVTATPSHGSIFRKREREKKDSDDSPFTIEDYDMNVDTPSTPHGSIFRKVKREKKDYGDSKWPCFQCGGDRGSQMVAQRSARCQKCFEDMRFKKYAKKQTTLEGRTVDEVLYFLVPKPYTAVR